MRGEGAGCFRQVADMSIVAANSRQPIALNKDKTTHISVRQCNICVMHDRYNTIFFVTYLHCVFEMHMFAAIKHDVMLCMSSICFSSVAYPTLYIRCASWKSVD